MILTSFLPRLIAFLLLIQIPVWWLADNFAPAASSFAYESIADKVCASIEETKEKNQKHYLDLAQYYNLAWIHVSDSKTKTVAVSTRPGNLPELSGEQSRVLEQKANRFVEITRPLSKESVSLGFRCPSLFDSVLTKGVWPGQLPFGTVAIATVLNAVALLGAYVAFFGLPLHRMLTRMSKGDEITESYPIYVSSELSQINHAVQSRFSNLRGEHEKSISAARSDLTGAMAKESDDRFLSRLLSDLFAVRKSDAVYSVISQHLSDDFIGVVKAGFGFEFPSTGKWRVTSSWGLSEEQSKILEELASSQFVVLARKMHTPTFLGKDELASKRLETMLGELNCDQCALIPMAISNTERAYLCLFVSNKEQHSVQRLERLVHRITERVSPIWSLIAGYDHAYRLSRHDMLTGLMNRVALEEFFHTLKYPQSGEQIQTELAYIVFEGDNFRQMLNSYGPRTIDRLIQEMAQQLIVSLEHSVRFKKASSRIDFAQKLYRVGACKFLLVLEDSNHKKATDMAESVAASVAERKDWAHAAPSWTVSSAVNCFLLKNANPEDSFEVALIALDYIRSRRSTGVVVSSKDVPEDFMSRAQSKNRGAIEALEPDTLLKKLEESQKTGILTASNDEGRMFWAYLEDGFPKKARLGSLCGDIALVEFVSSFPQVSYRMQDVSSLDAQTSSDMKNLGGAYLIQTDVNELIDFANRMSRLSSDAKVHLKTPDMIVHPTTEHKDGQIEETFFKAGKTPHVIYLNVVKKLWEISNGRYTLDEMILKMEESNPSALVWAAADFLSQNKLIKFSRLRVSVHTDASSEKEAGSATIQGMAAVKTAPAAQSGYVALPRMCNVCRTVDPLSQKFCVHCGAEMGPLPSRD